MGRVHPGETPSSFVIQEIISIMHLKQKILIENNKIIFWTDGGTNLFLINSHDLLTSRDS